MKTFVTFGQVHTHAVNGKTFDKDCVAVIEADSPEEGRERAFEVFGSKFCFTYPEEQWKEEEMLPFFPRGYINIDTPVNRG